MTTSPTNDAGFKRSLEIHQQIEAIYPRIEESKAFFRSAMPVDRGFSQPPGTVGAVDLDPIVCALTIKAATTKRAILAVCELGDGDNAIALARVLLENACLLEWLIRGEGRRRLEAFAMFTSVQHERVVWMVERHKDRFLASGANAELKSDAYHRSIWKHVFGDKRSYRPTWDFDKDTGKLEPVTVHDVFKEIADGKPSFEHDALYGAIGSDVVHSGPYSLSRIFALMGKRHTFTLQPMPSVEACTIALATSNTAMFLVLDSLAQYVGLDLSAELSQLKAQAQADPYALIDGTN